MEKTSIKKKLNQRHNNRLITKNFIQSFVYFSFVLSQVLNYFELKEVALPNRNGFPSQEGGGGGGGWVGGGEHGLLLR